MKQINTCFQEGFTAGGKAKLDIHDLLIERGIESLDCNCIETDKIMLKMINEIHKTLFLVSLLFRKESVYVVQHPFSHLRVVNKVLTFVGRYKKLIIIIHDLDGLRFHNQKKNAVEAKLLRRADYTISHNSVMSQYIENVMLVSKEKIVDLELFDYLYRGNEKKTVQDKRILNKNKRLTICYAGNLDKEKVPFVYELGQHKINYNVNLYGINYNGHTKNIVYKGSLPSYELIDKIEGDYGLVWDGAWDSSDNNEDVKNYTKYNNPHKLSLYMACGLPVIVWKGSAVAAFVVHNNIGFAIDTLDELSHISISSDHYQKQLENVALIRDRVRSGFYINRAFASICGERIC